MMLLLMVTDMYSMYFPTFCLQRLPMFLGLENGDYDDEMLLASSSSSSSLFLVVVFVVGFAFSLSIMMENYLIILHESNYIIN